MAKYTIAYKVFNNDWTCRGFQYKIGKTYNLPKGSRVELCRNGFHACKNLSDCFSYYKFDIRNKVALVHLSGEIKEGEDKICARTIKIVKELSWEEVLDMVNIGNKNTGMANIGNKNKGNRNIGNVNEGNGNIGVNNSGNSNIGSDNFGHGNSGNRNEGSYNLGSDNKGDRNLGSRNEGYNNYGYCNSGNNNYGSHNSGNYAFGVFNTQPSKIYTFNKPTDLTMEEFEDIHSWIERRLPTQEQIDDCSAMVNDIRALPNFNARIFTKITGLKLPRKGKK